MDPIWHITTIDKQCCIEDRTENAMHHPSLVCVCGLYVVIWEDEKHLFEHETIIYVFYFIKTDKNPQKIPYKKTHTHKKKLFVIKILIKNDKSYQIYTLSVLYFPDMKFQ